jgi:hypothetical protein
MNTKYSMIGMTRNHSVKTVKQLLSDDVYKKLRLVLEDSDYELGNKI